MKFTDEEIIAGCLKGSAAHQEALYKKFASKMLAVCQRYAHTSFEAEDIFQEAFVKVFHNLSHFQGKGSFEGWVRYIFINTAINHYNRNKKHYHQAEVEQQFDLSSSEADAMSRLSHEELLQLVQSLPEGYRMVFNLYVIEGYNHKEIGELLGINEGTSKSQLSKAKSILKKTILTLLEQRHVA